MGQYYTDFSEYENTAALLTNWTPRWVTSNVVWSLEEEEGRKVLKVTKTVQGRSALSWNVLDAALGLDNVEILIRMKIASNVSGNTHIGPVIRGSGEVTAETGIVAATNPTTTPVQIRLTHYTAGTVNAIDQSSLPIVTGEWNWLRFRVYGSTHYFKTWTGALSAEPIAWMRTLTNTTVPNPGWAGVFQFNAGSECYVDVFSVGTNGCMALLSPPPPIVNPPYISSWSDLAGMANNLNGNYVLTTDLDENSPGYETFAGSTANNNTGWMPIGNLSWDFTGTFDGQGHSIKGLRINRQIYREQGLFGRLGGNAIVERFRLLDIDFKGNARTAGVAPNLLLNAIVQDVFVSGLLVGATGTGSEVGAICGFMTGDSSSPRILRCGAVISAGEGLNHHRLAGIMGANIGTKGEIKDSYCISTLNSSSAGSSGFAANVLNNPAIHRCYSVTTFTATSGPPFINVAISDALSNFFDSDVVGTATAFGATPKTTSEMKTLATYADAGWDIVQGVDSEHVWGIDPNINNGYPFLQSIHAMDAQVFDPGDFVMYRSEKDGPLVNDDLDSNFTIINRKPEWSVVNVSPGGTYEYSLENTQENLTLSGPVTISAPVGSNNERILMRFNAGVSRELIWDFIFNPIGVELPVTTPENKFMYIGAIWNGQTSKWDVISLAIEE